MKQKLKLLFALSLAGILLFACQVDKELTNDSLYQENGKIMHKTFEDLIQEMQFKTAFEKINVPVKGSSVPKGNNTSRTVMESQYGFIIEDSPANVVVTEGITSYTFLIKRENTPNNVFENLIINLEPNKEPLAYLHKFTSSTSNNNEPFKIENFTGQKDLIKIEYNINQSSNKIQATEGCRIVREWFCGGPGNHTRDVEECGGHYIVSVKCTNGSSNQGNTTGGTTTSGSTTGTSSNGTAEAPTVVTAPVGPKPEMLDLDRQPCEKLNKINTKFPALSQSLLTLGATTSQNKENGLFIDNTATASTVNPIQNIPPAVGGILPINMNPTNQYVVLAHTHDAVGNDGTGTYSIFTWDDLATINNLIKNDHINTSNFVFYVITADGTRYALTIDSESNFSDFFYDPSNLPIGTQLDMKRLFDTQDKFVKYYDKKSNGLISTTSNPINDKANFLKFMKDANLGVSLFQVDATFTNYEKLTLNKQGVVTPVPCN